MLLNWHLLSFVIGQQAKTQTWDFFRCYWSQLWTCLGKSEFLFFWCRTKDENSDLEPDFENSEKSERSKFSSQPTPQTHSPAHNDSF